MATQSVPGLHVKLGGFNICPADVRRGGPSSSPDDRSSISGQFQIVMVQVNRKYNVMELVRVR